MTVKEFKGNLGLAINSSEVPDYVTFIQDFSDIDEVTQTFKAYKDGKVIVLLNPTSYTLSAAFGVLGFEGSHVDAAEKYEMVAFHKGVYCVNFHPITGPPAKGKDSLTPTAISNNPAPHQPASPDLYTAGLVKERLNSVFKWATKSIQDNKKKETSFKGVRMLAMAAGGPPQGDPSSIWQQANMKLGELQVPIVLNTSTSDPSVTKQVIFISSIFAASVNVFADPTSLAPYQKEAHDWYLVTMSGEYQPSDAFFQDSNQAKGWFVDWYKMQIVPTDYKSQSIPIVCAIQSSAPGSTPPSDIQTSISSSSSTSINGSIGFFGPTGTGSIGFSQSWTFGNSDSFVVSQCAIDNNSQTGSLGMANGTWTFTFIDPDPTQGEEPSSYQTSLFQPFVSCLWSMPTSARKLTSKAFLIDVSFDIQFVNMYLQDGGGWYKQVWQVSTDSSAPALSIQLPVIFPLTEADETQSTNEVTTDKDVDFFALTSGSAVKKGKFPKGTVLVIYVQTFFKGVKYTKVQDKDKKIATEVVWVNKDDLPSI